MHCSLYNLYAELNLNHTDEAILNLINKHKIIAIGIKLKLNTFSQVSTPFEGTNFIFYNVKES